MTLGFKILGSSSSGNASLIETPFTKVLVDAGFTARQLSQLLVDQGHSLQSIEGIFITHEHADHVSGLSTLPLHPKLKLFANAATASAIQAKVPRLFNWEIFETGKPFTYKDLHVCAFPIPHDAAEPVGYTFQLDENSNETPKSIGWVTDLGHIPIAIRKYIEQVHVLVIEANYDPDLLDQDHYRPWRIKQRIRGHRGHLSNYDTFEFINSTSNPLWKTVYLSHLSRNCNDVNLVGAVFSPIRSRQREFELHVVNPTGNQLPQIWL